MNNIKTIFLKEMKRLFTDKRMLMALFLPGILVFCLYEFIGNTISSTSIVSTPKDTQFSVAFTDNSGIDDAHPLIIGTLEAYFSSYEPTNSIKTTAVASDDATITKTKDDVTSGTFDVFIVFSDDFEKNIQTAQGSHLTNRITLFYNGSSENASYVYSLTKSFVSATYNNYSENITADGVAVEPNIGEGDAIGQKIMGFIFPMVTISLLFSAVMTICPETISGEKERGTLASVLLTPIKRSELAIGKILALSVASVASGAMSFLGLYLSLPSLLGQTNLSIGLSGGIALFLLIITALFLFVSLGMVVSSFARSIRETTSYLTPLMMVLMVVGFLPALMDISGIGFSFIPLFNISACMYLIISSGSVAPLYLLFTVLTNLALTGFFVFVTGKLFDNEKIMFNN